jgi:2-keto-4-pentenoate hydratase/2-oxohepta-3-ene-1,7-dioic acid hydratase in catechol pathway
MKLLYFDDFRLGVLIGQRVVDVSAVVRNIPHMGPHDLINRLIERFDTYKPRLEQEVKSSDGVPVQDVRIRPPLPKPGKIVCMAVNYLERPGAEMPPINAFLKSPNAVIGNGDTIVLPDAQPTIFEHEAELALVIGKRASKVKAADYQDYIFGYVNFIDVSARGLGAPPLDSFFPIKSWEGFAPLGPFLVTADEVTDPQSLSVKLWVGGDLRQDFSTDQMAHKIPRCIEMVSSITTLNPGDIVATGTNHQGLGPLQNGDAVEMETQGLGRLNINVSDKLKRQWPRETRAQKAAREAAQA